MKDLNLDGYLVIKGSDVVTGDHLNKTRIDFVPTEESDSEVF